MLRQLAPGLGRFFPLAIRGLRGRRRLKCILTVKRGITLETYRLLLRRHFTETQRRALAELPYTSIAMEWLQHVGRVDRDSDLRANSRHNGSAVGTNLVICEYVDATERRPGVEGRDLVVQSSERIGGL